MWRDSANTNVTESASALQYLFCWSGIVGAPANALRSAPYASHMWGSSSLDADSCEFSGNSAKARSARARKVRPHFVGI
jgi:hypothetical protein